MPFVDPIRNPKKIAQIKNNLRGAERHRDLLLFTFGINTALRISDLLTLQIEHVYDEHRVQRQQFTLLEQKTGKRHNVTINDAMALELEAFMNTYEGIGSSRADYLFFRQSRGRHFNQPISRVAAWELMVAICADADLTGNYGTHSLRKTWGYHAWQAGIPLPVIMSKLNHANLKETMRYLGITDDEIREAVLKLNL